MSTSLQSRGLQPWLAPYADALVAWAESFDPTCQVTSVLRSYSQQAMLYRRAQAGLSNYPAAPPGHSMHELGRAWDMIAAPATLAAAGAVWKSWGGTWGPSDPIHFQA